jgi:hypothetical protein
VHGPPEMSANPEEAQKQAAKPGRTSLGSTNEYRAPETKVPAAIHCSTRSALHQYALMQNAKPHQHSGQCEGNVDDDAQLDTGLRVREGPIRK